MFWLPTGAMFLFWEALDEQRNARLPSSARLNLTARVCVTNTDKVRTVCTPWWGVSLYALPQNALEADKAERNIYDNCRVMLFIALSQKKKLNQLIIQVLSIIFYDDSIISSKLFLVIFLTTHSSWIFYLISSLQLWE